jgi:hypothetical protein
MLKKTLLVFKEMGKIYGNTYFANELAIKNNSISNHIKHNSGRLIPIKNGDGSNITLDEDYTPDNYQLYLPNPRLLIAKDNDGDLTTNITIYNPNRINFEFRVEDWFSGATPYISSNQFPDFTSKVTSIEADYFDVRFALYKNPSNSNERAWFLLPES